MGKPQHWVFDVVLGFVPFCPLGTPQHTALFFYYMPINYISVLGVSLITEPWS